MDKRIIIAIISSLIPFLDFVPFDSIPQISDVFNKAIPICFDTFVVALKSISLNQLIQFEFDGLCQEIKEEKGV